MNIRMMPPGLGSNSIKVNGRTYTCAVGSTVDVPDFDAAVLFANGWIATPGGVGPTTARPSNPPANTQFNDTTVGSVVAWDGKTWRHVQSGASV